MLRDFTLTGLGIRNLAYGSNLCTRYTRVQFFLKKSEKKSSILFVHLFAMCTSNYLPAY